MTYTYASTPLQQPIWQSWNQGYYELRIAGNATTGTVTYPVTWQLWNNQYTTAIQIPEANGTAFQQPVWGNWNLQYVQAGNLTATVNLGVLRPRIDTEQRIYQALDAHDEWQRKYAAAAEKAEALLRSVLDEDQQRELQEKNHFHVVTRKGNVYQIRRGTHGNVKLIDPTSKKPKYSYCIQPDGVPAADAMAAQKLALEADEDSFLRIANRSAA
jgi:hypothetical protein